MVPILYIGRVAGAALGAVALLVFFQGNILTAGFVVLFAIFIVVITQ